MPDAPPQPDERDRLRALLQCLPGLVYVARGRVDRPVVHASEGTLDLLGYSHHDMESVASLTTLVHPEDRERVDREVERALERGNSLDVQYRIVRADGSERWVWDRATLTPGAEGGPLVFRGCLLDVTRQRHMENRIRTAQRREAVGRISAGVAHQFNNLLTAILGSLELCLHEVADRERAREELREAQGAAQKAADLVRQLLAFTRPSTWIPEPVDLNDVLREMEVMLHRILGSRVRLVLVLDPGLPGVSVDPRQIEQVILNLVLNAKEAMPHGGRIVLATGVQELPPDELRRDDRHPPGHYVAISVTDTGEGILPDIRGSIFEPFFTTRDDRTGLGLSTAFGIVEQSRGMIRVASTPGRGSTFTVLIPAEEGSRQREREVGAAPTLLVVEDEEAVRGVLVRTLSREGFRLLEAADGETALRVAERHAGPIDMLLCDVMLPGMRGPRVARTLARSRPEMRVLFMSGYVHPSELERLGVEGGAPLMPKPFTIEELLERVARMMQGPPPNWPAEEEDEASSPEDEATPNAS